jgi:hypothetical protein
MASWDSRLWSHASDRYTEAPAKPKLTEYRTSGSNPLTYNDRIVEMASQRFYGCCNDGMFPLLIARRQQLFSRMNSINMGSDVAAASP